MYFLIYSMVQKIMRYLEENMCAKKAKAIVVVIAVTSALVTEMCLLYKKNILLFKSIKGIIS